MPDAKDEVDRFVVPRALVELIVNGRLPEVELAALLERLKREPRTRRLILIEGGRAEGRGKKQ